MIEQLVRALELRIERLNKERLSDGEAPLPKLTLVLLGQFALFADPAVRSRFHLSATRDLDALIEGGWNARALVKEALAELNFEYDDLSREIWMPAEATQWLVYDSQLLTVKAFDAISVIVSKAVKAPAKNRYIVRQGLMLYGDELAQLITRYGGIIEEFLNKP